MGGLSRRQALASGVAGAASMRRRAWAQGPVQPVQIGVLGDQSGITADAGGPGTVEAVRMAVADFGSQVGGRPVEVLVGDMLMKPDAAAQMAARWYDVERVDVIVDLPLTSAAMAVLEVARSRRKATLVTAAASSDFTGAACSPTNVHWIDDTYSLANVTARAVVARGDKSWFFLTADYAFGAAMQHDASEAIVAAGGSVVGAVKHPLGITDFSNYLLQASASAATVVGFASVGGDTINAVKQAAEFRLKASGKRLAGFLVFITDIHAIGLADAQGLYVSSGFYWDQNEAARKFGERFFASRRAMPTKSQASSYSATLHWLKAVQATGDTDALRVNETMRKMPGDFFGKPVRIRADGRALYDMILYRVKTPAEATRPWDYYKPLRVVAADEAFRPAALGACRLPA